MSKPWGHQLIVHIYKEGEATEEEFREVERAIDDVIPSAWFVGMSLQVIDDEPSDQVNT